MPDSDSTPPPGRRFPTTRWSRVVAAGGPDSPAARAALAVLCQAYWYPLYAFIRRRGHDADLALDLVQGYFARLLERRVLAAADPDKGRFRTFLMADCSHFLAHERARADAQKRGGGRVLVSIDAAAAEGRFRGEPAHGTTPERLFERAWAVTVLDGVLSRLRAEYARNGTSAVFECLKPVLTDGPAALSYAMIAARLGTTEGAVQVAVHRLRRRYGILLRRQIATTVRDPAEVEDEIRALLAALGP
jgi:RNA polymerase sigma-70 factor (ECF subfamily)